MLDIAFVPFVNGQDGKGVFSVEARPGWKLLVGSGL